VLYDEDHADAFRKHATAGWNPDVLRPLLWQFSRQGAATEETINYSAGEPTDEAKQLGMLQHSGAPKSRHLGETSLAALAKADNIQVLLNANAVSIETDKHSSAVSSVRIRSIDHKEAELTARCVVLACGGIDNARLLLCSRSSNPAGLGNDHDMVGRFLTDHPFWRIASYSGSGDKRFRRALGNSWIDRGGDRHVFATGLRLSPQIQRREQLLNCAIHIVELGREPPSVSRLGKSIRLARDGNFGAETRGEMFAALARPVDLISGVYSRYVSRQPALGHPDSVLIGAVVEQVADPASRVTLSDEIDALGMNRARIDWRISEREFQTAKRMAEVLKQEMQRLAFPLPNFPDWLADHDIARIRSDLHDVAHAMGSTRMSELPSEGVVDANSKVHGVNGLYVAGGSVFSTSGYMDPTFNIVALSLRLADHLKSLLARQASAVPAAPDRTGPL